MKKILTLIVFLSFFSCSDTDNPATPEQAFIALNAIQSFLTLHKDDEASPGSKNCETGTYSMTIVAGDISGYLISACVFVPIDDFLTLRQECNKTSNQEITGTIDLSKTNKVFGAISFKELFVGSCSYNLTIDSEHNITAGTICGVDLVDLSDFSVSSPISEVCTNLN